MSEQPEGRVIRLKGNEPANQLTEGLIVELNGEIIQQGSPNSVTSRPSEKEEENTRVAWETYAIQLGLDGTLAHSWELPQLINWTSQADPRGDNRPNT